MRFIRWIIAGLAAALAIFTMGRKSAADQIRAETAEQARELEKRVHEINQKGADEEQRIRDAINNNPVRDIDLD